MRLTVATETRSIAVCRNGRDRTTATARCQSFTLRLAQYMLRASLSTIVAMHRNLIPLVVLAAALSTCAIEPEQLNSERIRERFGSYGIEVISSQSGMRRSILFSVEGQVRTCRTYALVRFSRQPDAIVRAEHEQVVAGHSIGEIFKASGWEIRKESLYVGEVGLDSPQHPVAALMRLQSAQHVAVHVYRLSLRKNGQTIEYATITELHHPAYLALSELRNLYPVDMHVALTPDEVDDITALVLDGV